MVIVDSAEELQQKQQPPQIAPQSAIQPAPQLPPQAIQNKIMSPLTTFTSSGFTPNHLPKSSSKSPRVNHINIKTPEHRNGGSGGSASGTPTHSSLNNGKVHVIGSGSSRTPNRTPSRTPTRTPTPTAAVKQTPSPVRQRTPSVSPHPNQQNATVASTSTTTTVTVAQGIPSLICKIDLVRLSNVPQEWYVNSTARHYTSPSPRSLPNRTPPVTVLDERLMTTNAAALIKTAGGNTTPRENVRLSVGLVNNNSPRLATKVDATTTSSSISSPQLIKPIKMETNANSTTYMFEYADYNAESFDNFKKLANNNNTVKQEQFIKNEIKQTPPLTEMSPPVGKEGEKLNSRKRSSSGSKSPFKEKKRKKDKGSNGAGNNGFGVSRWGFFSGWVRE